MNREVTINEIIKNCSRYYTSNDTIETYERYIRQFFEFCPKEIEEITKRDIVRWLAHLRNNEGFSSRTIHICIAALKAFFEECSFNEVVETNPALKLEWPKLEELEPKSLDNYTIFKLKEAVKKHPRDRAIVEVLHRTGIRVSELINIHIEDVWWDERQIWIRKGKGLKERIVPISRICKHYLQEYLATRNDDNPFLFISKRNKEFTRQGIYKIIKKYCKKAGIKENVYPHRFRHTLITELINKGADEAKVADLSGHKNLDSLQTYAKASKTKLKTEYDRM
ncbi:MAG: tyrosine-type recombinase/integrase [Epulopiscium sp.]|nr:tyrosine-type recombinase/integrase [Candidatus Epulonipiscium sp.]